ncbi:hypothetical protein BGZ94_006038 [Podila epigama]|nr:hypothetical protein BGZ94_006038 [Podila epigama]
MHLKRPRALSIDTSKEGLLSTRARAADLSCTTPKEETPTPPSCRLEKIYEEKLEILGVIGYENWFDDHANPFYRQQYYLHLQSESDSVPATVTATTDDTVTTSSADVPSIAKLYSTSTRVASCLPSPLPEESLDANPFQDRKHIDHVDEGVNKNGTMSQDMLVFPLASTMTTTRAMTPSDKSDDDEEEFTGFESLASDTSSCCSVFGLGISFDQDDDDNNKDDHNKDDDAGSFSDCYDSDEERDVFDSDHTSCERRGLWDKTFGTNTIMTQPTVCIVPTSPSSTIPTTTSSSNTIPTLTNALHLHRQQLMIRRLSNRNRIMDRGHLLPDTTITPTYPSSQFLSPSIPLSFTSRQAGIPFATCGSKVRALSPYPKPYTRT